MYKQALALRKQMAPKDKYLWLDNTLQTDATMLAILTVCEHTDMQRMRMSAILLAGLDSSAKSIDLVSEVNELYRHFTKGDRGFKFITSSEALEVVLPMLNSSSIGLTRAQLSRLLGNHQMSLEAACRILGLESVHTAPTTKACGVCGRNMASVTSTNICSFCRMQLREFLSYRRGTFKVPLNSFNFSKFKEVNNRDINYTLLDYTVIKEGGDLICSHITEPLGFKKQLPLPFEEYAKQITVL